MSPPGPVPEVPAPAGRRLFARLVDVVAVLVFAVPVLALTLQDDAQGSGVRFPWPVIVAWAVVPAVVEAVVLKTRRGQTPGKRLSGLRVTARTGGPRDTARTGGPRDTARTGGPGGTARTGGPGGTARTGGPGGTARTGEPRDTALLIRSAVSWSIPALAFLLVDQVWLLASILAVLYVPALVPGVGASVADLASNTRVRFMGDITDDPHP